MPVSQAFLIATPVFDSRLNADFFQELAAALRIYS